MGQLENQVALVTGGAGGIGSAIARLFANEGAAVMIADSSGDGARALAAEITGTGGRAQAAPLDVTDSGSVQRVIGDTVQQFGGLTCLVNAAAILRTGHIDEMDEQAWQELLAVNVTGTFLCTKHAVPRLKAAGGGSIINLSSVSAFIGSSDGFAYGATKGAVLSFTFGIAQELAPFGIRVNALCPGWVDGGFTHQAMRTHPNPELLRAQANSLHALGRMARPDEVAQGALFLASGAASFVTGTPLFIDGGYMIKR